MNTQLAHIKKNGNWSLFLDRDGVINKRLMDDYVKSVDEFEFIDGVLQAIKDLSEIFRHMFIVTNQQGVGRGLMSEADLNQIHNLMLKQIKQSAGRIDQIYYCTDLSNKPLNCRKPGISMAVAAKKDYPDIDFERAIMVGDTKSDMEFAQNVGMKAVFIGEELPDTKIDYHFLSLFAFSKFLLSIQS